MVSTPIMRWLMDWHFMRIIISVIPTALYWWPGGDFSQPAQTVEVEHVG